MTGDGQMLVSYHRDPPTPEVVTPNIDSLVKQGLELDQHYAFRVCTPSRCSLLTGRLPIHVDDDRGIEPTYYNPKDPVSGFQGIPRNMTVIAEKLGKDLTLHYAIFITAMTSTMRQTVDVGDKGW